MKSRNSSSAIYQHGSLNYEVSFCTTDIELSINDIKTTLYSLKHSIYKQDYLYILYVFLSNLLECIDNNNFNTLTKQQLIIDVDINDTFSSSVVSKEALQYAVSLNNDNLLINIDINEANTVLITKSYFMRLVTSFIIVPFKKMLQHYDMDVQDNSTYETKEDICNRLLDKIIYVNKYER